MDPGKYDNLEFPFDKAASLQIKRVLEKIIFQRQEQGVLHNSYELSGQLFEIIKEGDADRFEQAVQFKFSCVPGILADEPLRSAKNFLICICSNIVCHLIENKLLDAELAYSVSDAGIQMIEKAKTKFDAYQTLFACIYEFIEQRIVFTKKQYHPLIKAADGYIFQNLHEKIEISKMAEELGTSPSYLSQVFRKYLGKTIQEYVADEKTARAKKLLRFSDYSLQEISGYLGFSSQSKLGQELKKREGLTPKKYREKYKITDKIIK